MTSLNNLTTYINLEMTGDTRPYLVSAKQGDKATRYVAAKLLNNGEIYVIPGDSHAVINIRKPDGKHVYNTCEHNTEEIIVELTNQILAVAGTAYCDIEIRTEDNTQIITSASFTLEIEEAIRSDKAIKSSNEFTELENKCAKINETERKIGESEKEREEAENERKNNEESRILQEEKRQQDTEQSIEKAKTAAEVAENAANNCKKAIESAENFELQGESYAKEAKSWAIGEGEVRDDEEINNSKYYAEQAKKIVETISEQNTDLVQKLSKLEIKLNKLYYVEPTSLGLNKDSTLQDLYNACPSNCSTTLYISGYNKLLPDNNYYLLTVQKSWRGLIIAERLNSVGRYITTTGNTGGPEAAITGEWVKVY